MRRPTRRTTLAAVPLLAAGATGLALAAPAAAADGDAQAAALDASLLLELGEEEVLAIEERLAATAAPTEDGTDSDEIASVPIDEESLGLQVDVLRSASTRDGGDLAADADVTRATLRLGDTEVLDAEVLSADVTCPAGGPATADAQVASVIVGGEPIDLDADAVGELEVPVDLDLEEGGEVTALVSLSQIEQADDTSAQAAALVADVSLRATLADTEVAHVHVGELTFAEATCEVGSATTTPPEDGTEGDGTEDDGTEDDDAALPVDPSEVIDELTGEGDDGDGTEDDGTEGEGTDADRVEAEATADEDGEVAVSAAGTAGGDGEGALPRTGTTTAAAVALALLLLTGGALLLTTRGRLTAG